MRDVKVKFIGVEASELAPSCPADLVDGEPWVVYGRYEAAGVGRAEVRGVRSDGEPFFLEVPVDLPAEGARAGLAALWAATRIRELEASEEDLDPRRRASLRARVIELAKKHRVSSKFTSFVVVDKREGDRRTSTPAKARPVAVHAVARSTARGKMIGMPGMAPAAQGMPAPRFAPPPPPAMAMAMAPAPRAMAAPSFAVGHVPPPRASAAPAAFGPPPSLEGGAALQPMAMRSAPEVHHDPIQALFAAQLANGLWQRDGSLESTLEATATALATCVAEGISTAHPLFGVPVKKAVAALLTLVAAPAVATRTDLEARLAIALTAAYLVSSGPKLRASVVTVVKASSLEGVRALASELVGDERAKAKLQALRA